MDAVAVEVVVRSRALQTQQRAVGSQEGARQLNIQRRAGIIRGALASSEIVRAQVRVLQDQPCVAS